MECLGKSVGLGGMGCLLSMCECLRPWVPWLWEAGENRRGGGGRRKDHKEGKKEGKEGGMEGERERR